MQGNNNPRQSSHQGNKQVHFSPNLLSTINNAIDNQLVATIEYESRENGITLRDIEPIALVYKDRKRNLIGWCRLREDFRSFRIDRLNAIKVRHEGFEQRAGFDINQYQDAPGNQANDTAIEDEHSE
jgi:predicted DNA-binding transcriptional regulator YafY